MTLVDTSAWVEYLRGTGSTVHEEVRRLIAADAALALNEVIVMEILAGARGARHERELQRFAYRFALLPVGGLAAHEEAARLYRTCRTKGETVRKLTDCLIAAVAIREDVPVLHHDGDYDILSRHTALRVHGVGS